MGEIQIPKDLFDAHKGTLFEAVPNHSRVVWDAHGLAQDVARWMREECAKVAEKHHVVEHAKEPNDGRDSCALAIAEGIRLIGSNHE